MPTAFCITFALLLTVAGSAFASSDSTRVAPVPFTYRVDWVSRADMIDILRVVHHDLLKRRGHPAIRSVAIVSRRKAIVSYGPEAPWYGEFCIVERCSSGWCVTQHKSWNA
jgi:hypothetical protein